MYRKRNVAWLVAAALVLAACGGTSAREVAGEALTTSPSGGADDGAPTASPHAMHDGTMHATEQPATGGQDGSVVADDGTLVVEIEMVDVAFAPTAITVPAGEPVRFVFHNTGTAVHEAVIGDEHVQSEHEEAMQAGEGHGDAHGDEHHGAIPSISLDPGEQGELVHTFDAAGTTLIGCHVPGHYAAGMVVEVQITG